MERQKALIEKKADLDKAKASESEDESQKLSDSEDEFYDGSETVIFRVEESKRQASSANEGYVPKEHENLTKGLQMRLVETEAKMSGKQLVGEDSSSEDEELTRRLLFLEGAEQPKKTLSLKTNKKGVKKTQSSTAAIVEGLAKLLVTAGKKGQQSSSEETRKFMARQVLGKDLPVFNGKAEEWATFISSFENTTKECGFTDVENLGRLQKCLKGEAHESVGLVRSN